MTADGARIAYQVFGQGPPTLVASAGSFSHTDALWEDPAASVFYARLASFAEVVRYDRLGTSNSDPFPPGWEQDWKGYARELEAVLEVIEEEKVVLLAMLDAGPVALRFAADQPERVSKLILYNATARFARADDYVIGWSPETFEGLLSSVETTWGTETQVAMNVPSRLGDEAFTEWYGKYVRAIGTPNTMVDTLRRLMSLDVRSSLPSITVPTLILHRTDYSLVPVSHGRFLADHIPGSTFTELPGADGPLFWEAPDLTLSYIRDFLAEDAALSAATSEIAAVLFTDIVGSTERLRSMGDREWTALLGVHDQITARTVAASRGRLIKSTGDGALATFPEPEMAMACARDLRHLLGQMGIAIRAGIHMGTVEFTADDVGGLAVHIAARVMGAASDGEIVVSRTVRDVLLGSKHRLIPIGPHQLKGVEGDWDLYRLDWSS